MVDFDIIDINEAIDGLSYEEQLNYLKEKENEIGAEMEELKTLLSEIGKIKNEIDADKSH